jgi:hypothetical protein
MQCSIAAYDPCGSYVNLYGLAMAPLRSGFVEGSLIPPCVLTTVQFDDEFREMAASRIPIYYPSQSILHNQIYGDIVTNMGAVTVWVSVGG